MAINPQDLRLGNLLLVSGKPSEVTSIYPDGVQVRYTYESKGEIKFSSVIAASFEGIPLADAYLEGVSGITVKWSLKGRAEISMCGIPITVIEYLHEWQNLYYILFGSELEVKP